MSSALYTRHATFAHSSSSKPKISCALSRRPKRKKRSARFCDDERLVVVLRRGADECVDRALDRVAHLGGRRAGANELLEAIVSELVFRFVLRFGDAVAVEHDGRSGRER